MNEESHTLPQRFLFPDRKTHFEFQVQSKRGNWTR